MSTPRDDQLYTIFEERLLSGEFDDQPTEVLLADVVDRYLTWLGADRAVPVHMRQTVRNDLLDDVRDMLRLKIYGHLGIGEFNKSRRGK